MEEKKGPIWLLSKCIYTISPRSLHCLHDLHTWTFHFHRRPVEPCQSICCSPSEGQQYSVNNCVFIGHGQRRGRRDRHFPIFIIDLVNNLLLILYRKISHISSLSSRIRHGLCTECNYNAGLKLIIVKNILKRHSYTVLM